MADTCRSAPTDGAFIAYNCPRDSGDFGTIHGNAVSSRQIIIHCCCGPCPPRVVLLSRRFHARNSGPKSAKGKKGDGGVVSAAAVSKKLKLALRQAEDIKERPSCCTAIEVAAAKDATGFGAAVSLRPSTGRGRER